MQQDRHQVSCFLTTRDIVGLIFDPHTTRCSKSKFITEFFLASHRREVKSCAVNVGNSEIKFAYQLHDLFVAHCIGSSKLPPHHILAKSDERIWVIVNEQIVYFINQQNMMAITIFIGTTPRCKGIHWHMH